MSRPSSAAKRSSSFSSTGGRKSAGSFARSSSTEKPPSGKTKNIAQGLLSKEEEYMRLNAQLEERTASLIKETEEVMHDQDELLARPTASEAELSEDLKDLLPSMDFSNVDIPSSSAFKQKPEGSSITTTQTRSVSSTAGKQGSRPTSRTKKTKPKSKISSATGSVTHTPVPSDDPIDMLQDRITLANTISALEDEAQDFNYTTTTTDDSVLPVGAEEMGSEATIRFLKAKLRVMQEELDRVVEECNKKDEKKSAIDKKVKELTEEQGRLQKTNQGLQSQIDKYKKLYDDCKHKNDGLEQQMVSLRKDLDSIQREQKHAASNKNVTEVRLNRALEEAEKYRTALQKAKSQSKDSGEQDRKRIDHLLAENKRLEKQKNELMAGFKKQMKLIDVLKRQKMHIEAAKLLQFSEEEFVKALDWGN